MTQTVYSVVNCVSRKLKLTGCTILTALSLAAPQKYLSSSFRTKNSTYPHSFLHFSTAGTESKWHSGRPQVCRHSYHPYGSLTWHQPCACFVYFNAVTYSKQENCIPCITHSLETYVLQHSILKLVVHILAERSSDGCAERWQASSLLALQQLEDMLFTQIGAVNKNTTKHRKHHDSES